MYEVLYSKHVKNFFTNNEGVKEIIIDSVKEIKECPFEKSVWNKYDIKKIKKNESLYRRVLEKYRIIFYTQNNKFVIFSIKTNY
ncbi:MAG: hypothetical protein ABF289_05380 [Clostridiales bacterium]